MPKHTQTIGALGTKGAEMGGSWVKTGQLGRGQDGLGRLIQNTFCQKHLKTLYVISASDM